MSSPPVLLAGLPFRAETPPPKVRLVAVSKFKPAADILSLHTETGHRHFGENYVQGALATAHLRYLDSR